MRDLLYLTACLLLLLSSGNLHAQTTNVQFIDLPTVLRLAGARNLDIQIANRRLAEAKANEQTATWQFFPWLSPGVGYRRHDDLLQDVGGNIIDVHKQSYTVGPSVVGQIDLGDAIYKTLVAHQLVKAADFALGSQRLESLLAATQSYFDLTRAAAESQVVRESLKISQDYQTQLHEAVSAGIAYKGDELRIQVQTELYQLSLRQALEQERLNAARLAEHLHLDPIIVLASRDTGLVPLTIVERNAALDSLVHQALRSRPEIFQTQAVAGAASEEKQATIYGPLIPAVSAQAFAGGLGGGRQGGSDSFGASEDYGIGLNWRIGPGGLFDAGRKRAAQARLDIATLNKTKLADQITRQVVETFTTANSLADQLITAKTNLSTASEVLRLSSARREFGVAAVLENIQAQQDLARARSEYLRIVAEHNKAQYALYAAIGNVPTP